MAMRSRPLLKMPQVWLVLLVGVSALYFGALSGLEPSAGSAFIWKSLAIVLPVQVGACIYFLYRYWAGKIPGTTPYQKDAVLTRPGRPRDPE